MILPCGRQRCRDWRCCRCAFGEEVNGDGSDRLRPRRRSPPISAPAFAHGSARLDRRDLGRANDRQDRQPRPMTVRNRHVARPRAVLGGGDHQHPEQPETALEGRVGNDQGRAALGRCPVRIGKWHRDDIISAKGRHNPSGRVRTPFAKARERILSTRPARGPRGPRHRRSQKRNRRRARAPNASRTGFGSTTWASPRGALSALHAPYHISYFSYGKSVWQSWCCKLLRPAGAAQRKAGWSRRSRFARMIHHLTRSEKGITK